MKQSLHLKHLTETSKTNTCGCLNGAVEARSRYKSYTGIDSLAGFL
jgi:hypothetical protein